MNPALLKLMRLQTRGLLRRMGRGVKTVRGALTLAVGLVVFVAWLASAVVSFHVSRPDPDSVRGVMPLLLLGVCLMTALTSAGDKAIAFTPGEVDFLFPGPFGRRQLLLYKVAKSTAGSALGALVVSVALRKYAQLWVACFFGIFLSLLLVQLLGTVLVLLGQTVGEKAYTRGRRVALLAVVLAAAAGLQGVLSGYSLASVDVPAVLQQFGRSPAGRVLLAPFDLFAQTFTAGRVFPDLVKWGAQALLVDGLLLVAVLQLDAGYLEAAAGASQRRHERLKRLRGGAALSLGAGATARRRMPRPPFLGGMGPIAWRQAVHAARSAKGLLLVLVLLAVAVGPLAFATPSRPTRSDAPFIALMATLAWLSVLLATLLKFDFRADLDAMDVLKTLPLPSWAIAAGQLVAPTVVLTGIHWLLLAATARAFGPAAGRGPALAVAAALSLPFNLLLFAAENLLFLVFPTRPTGSGPGDFQLVGRQTLNLALRSLVVGLGLGVAAVAGVVAFVLTDHSPVALAAAAGVVLLAEAAALLPLIAWAFRRFDPSTHTPA